MGLIFLAAITELPELVTTSAAALGGNAALALNNMFGGITMQTAILVVADAAALHVTLTSVPRKSHPGTGSRALDFAAGGGARRRDAGRCGARRLGRCGGGAVRRDLLRGHRRARAV